MNRGFIHDQVLLTAVLAINLLAIFGQKVKKSALEMHELLNT